MLTETVFRSEDVPREDRFDAWRQCMSRTMAPMEVTSGHAANFAAHQRMLRLGSACVWSVTTQASRYRRTPRLIRRSDPELYHLTLVLPGSGTLSVVHGDRETEHRSGALYLLDSSRPFDVTSGDGRELVGIGVGIPRAVVPLPGSSRTDELLGRRLAGQQGFGALLAQFLTGLSADSASYRPTDIPRLNTVLVDLVGGLLAHALGADAVTALPAEARDRHLVRRVRAHIERWLHDPELTPGTVAAAHHVSLRRLHRLFEGEDVTVAGLIRARRLERARRDLADPALHGTPVHAIAARCGFAALPHFSRAFRTAYGIAPSDYRRLAQRGEPGTDGQHLGTVRQRRGAAAAAVSKAPQVPAA